MAGVIDVRQLRAFIVRPALEAIDLWSLAAERLVLGTAAHESGGFRWLHQVGGPAVSWWQIEPATYVDLMERTVPRLAQRYPRVVNGLLGMAQKNHRAYPPSFYLMHNAAFAAACCRVLYFRAPEAMPHEDDLDGMAAFWKLRYNTPLGRGRPEQWLDAYRTHVARVYA